MNRKLSSLSFLALFFVSAAAVTAQTTAFVGVNVIPMDRERVLRNQTVIVRDGRIADIGDAKRVKVPADAVRIEAAGKYLMPGLVDMHTHLLSDGDDYPDAIAEDELRVMVANGVTTIRFMIGTPEQLILRSRSAKGEIAAPTIFSASPHLTGKEQGNNFVVNTPEEAREAVRKSKAAGYDFIKITTFIKAEVYEAAVDEAAKQNIRVVGHADSRFVGVERAWKAKQQIEHLDGYMELLLKADAPMKGSVSDLYIYNPANWASFDHMDETKIPEIARKTVEANPFVNPTQHFMKNSFGVARSEESIRAQPDFKFYPAKVQENWLNFYKKNKMLNTIPLEQRARWIELRDKLIKAIYDAGGKLMAGSDTPEFLFLYGYAMHHELKALKDAGIPNYAALAAGTRNPQEFLGVLDKVGTVEKGKRADLMLLNANPLDDIGATKNRAGVMLKGKWYEQAELDRWLDEIAPRIAGSYIEPKPDDKAAVLAVVKKLFDEMAAANAAGILSTSTKESMLVAVQKLRDGTTRIDNITGEQFTKFFTKPGAVKEVMYDPKVEVSGDWAMVWGRYVFFAEGKLLHCGINQFNMVRTEQGWKIAGGASTIDRNACTESEKAMKP